MQTENRKADDLRERVGGVRETHQEKQRLNKRKCFKFFNKKRFRLRKIYLLHLKQQTTKNPRLTKKEDKTSIDVFGGFF